MLRETGSGCSTRSTLRPAHNATCAGLKAIKAALGQALLLLLVAGEQQDVGPLLARCGAAALKAEVHQLAGQLGKIAALNEAVHGGVLDLLSSGLV